MLTVEDFKSTWGKMSDLQRHGTFSSVPRKKKKKPIIFTELSKALKKTFDFSENSEEKHRETIVHIWL